MYHNGAKGPPSRHPSPQHHRGYLETYNHIRKKHSPSFFVNKVSPSFISSTVQWSLQRAENLTHTHPTPFGIDTLDPSLQFIFPAACNIHGSPATLDLYPTQLALNSRGKGDTRCGSSGPSVLIDPSLLPKSHSMLSQAPLQLARPAALSRPGLYATSCVGEGAAPTHAALSSSSEGPATPPTPGHTREEP